jgi:hypothetical protein
MNDNKYKNLFDLCEKYGKLLLDDSVAVYGTNPDNLSVDDIETLESKIDEVEKLIFAEMSLFDSEEILRIMKERRSLIVKEKGREDPLAKGLLHAQGLNRWMGRGNKANVDQNQEGFDLSDGM